MADSGENKPIGFGGGGAQVVFEFTANKVTMTVIPPKPKKKRKPGKK